MHGWDTLVLLRHLLGEGLSKTAIAAHLGVTRRVVYHSITTGQPERDLSATPPPAPKPIARCETALGPQALGT